VSHDEEGAKWLVERFIKDRQGEGVFLASIPSSSFFSLQDAAISLLMVRVTFLGGSEGSKGKDACEQLHGVGGFVYIERYADL
jgi:hypothetical protein